MLGLNLQPRHKELIQLGRKCIPKLTPQLYKGQCGKICVVGGCEEYTGAPYFSAHAASIFGSDLVYLLCENRAGPPIKSYSPNLMVHPYLADSHSYQRGFHYDETKVTALVQRCHVLVVGPGLGRDDEMMYQVLQIVSSAPGLGEDKDRCLIIDADGLYLLASEKYSKQMQKALKDYGEDRVVITPNVVELKRIMKALNVDSVEEVSKTLGCITVAKGNTDVIVNSRGERWESDVQGSMKRCGGQGDTLTGLIATMFGFSRAVHDWNLEPLSVSASGTDKDHLSWSRMAMLSCYIGSTATRLASRLAYEKVGRQLQTTDMNNIVGEVFNRLYPSSENKEYKEKS